VTGEYRIQIKGETSLLDDSFWFVVFGISSSNNYNCDTLPIPNLKYYLKNDEIG